MTTIYIVFGTIFAVLVICAIVVGGYDVKLICERRRTAAEKEKAKKAVPVEIVSNDYILRVKNADIEMYDAPAEESVEEIAEPTQTESEPEEVLPPVEKPAEGLVEVPEGSVILMRGEKMTFAEKYEALSEEEKALLDEFAAYVTDKEDCSKQLQISSLVFKYRRSQIVKAVIRRDAVLLQFSIVNPDFGRMVRQEKTEGLRVKPVEIRLIDEDALEVAKQTADITLAYVRGEEDYKLEKRREARREAARLRREEAERREAAAENENPIPQPAE